MTSQTTVKGPEKSVDCGVDQNSVTCNSVGYITFVKPNSTPAVATADWVNMLALVTENGHASEGDIGFYTTTHSANCVSANDTYGELYDPNHDMSILRRSGSVTLSPGDVPITSGSSGTPLLTLDDIFFVALAGCDGYDKPGAIPGVPNPVSSAQALANAGVDVVLSWSADTYSGAELYVYYFLQGAFSQNGDGSYMIVAQAQEYAKEQLENVLPPPVQGQTLKPWNDPSLVENNVSLTGATRADGKPPGAFKFYPPRYGSKKTH